MKPESTDQEAVLLERTRVALDASANQLDYASQLQLQRARARALAALTNANEVPAKNRWSRQWLWLTAVPAALVLVLALPLMQSPTPSLTPVAGPAIAQQPGDDAWQALADLELLAAEPELEELADIEFYQWLEEQDGAGPV